MNKNREDNAGKNAPQAQKTDRSGSSGYGSVQPSQKPAGTTAQNPPQSAPPRNNKSGEKLDTQSQKDE